MSGEMADFALDMGDDDLERRPHESVTRRMECVHCGAWPLEWRMHEGGWRLFRVAKDGETLHACDAYRAALAKAAP
jgi:hypothetical protein